MSKKIITIFLLFLLFFTVKGHTLNIQTVQNIAEDNNLSANENFFIYNVKYGDSLYKIARKYETTVKKIKTSNNLQSNMIYVGQKLKISVNKTIITYQIKPGDTLYKIAHKYDTTVNKIKSYNNLQSNMIYAGRKLYIPLISTFSTVKGQININNKTGSLKTQEKKSQRENNVLSLYNNFDFDYKNSEIIVKYKPLTTAQTQNKLEESNNLVSINSLTTETGKIINYKISSKKSVKKIVEQYQQLDNVAWAEPNYIYYPTSIPADKYYNYNQWNYINLNLEAAWDIEKGDSSVKVAVLDTGIIPNHPDLKGHLLQGADFVGGENIHPVSSYSKTDSDPTDETAREKGGSHGTHVAGIIGALTDNQKGIAGVNWNINLLPVRVLTRNGGTSWDIVEGIYYAIDQGADIINLSLGSRYRSQLQAEVLTTAKEKGVTIVAATGNEGSSVYYPAAFPETIAVGSVDKNNNITGYSNFGPEVDVVAPGGGYGESIYSTWGYYQQGETISGYMGMIGTSMAAPHISGIAALLVANGTQKPENIRKQLTDTARDLGKPGKDNYYGYGLVDAYGALLGGKLEKPEVFAVTKENNTLKLKSEITTIRNDGSFSLNKVKTGNLYIVGWRDVNENGKIDKGDYYGESSQPLSITAHSTYNVNLSINYISSSGQIKVQSNFVR